MVSQPQGNRGAGRRWASPAVLVATALCFLLPPPAHGAFHLMMVREVHTGGAANDSYVVLQAYGPNQNFVGGKTLTAYNASGTAIGTFTFPGNVVNDESQMTILVADTGYATGFPSGPAPDGTASDFDLAPSGGAVCFDSIDCVSWGNFSGSLTPAAGTPVSAGGVSAGEALHRSIARGCSTLLEAADDTNSSAADFSEQAPNPRSNASPIVETNCPSLPNTFIGTAPDNPTKSTSASFTFTASPSSGATFECRLDAESFASCSSPEDYAGLSEGTHSFEVRAVNSAGADPTPDSHEWRIDLTPPVATILTQPDDPSPGNSASFTFQSNETSSTFECSLVPEGQADSFSPCSSPKTYEGLPDGVHVFKVKATDQAKNVGAADEYSWQVDNSLADPTPPQTTITASPPDPSTSATAAFSYTSSEVESTFECALDGAPFAACPPAGVQYAGLANGQHSFQVRATDSSGNRDESPAGYSWQVALSAALPPPPPPAPPAIVVDRSPRALQTKLTRKPPKRTRDRTPTFAFRANVRRARFLCKLDRARFRPCRSPFTTKKLKPGRHTFKVRAKAGRTVDRTPARFSFRVVKAPRAARASLTPSQLDPPRSKG